MRFIIEFRSADSLVWRDPIERHYPIREKSIKRFLNFPISSYVTENELADTNVIRVREYCRYDEYKDKENLVVVFREVQS